MKEKIVGIFVMTLLILSSITVSGIVIVNKTNTNQQKTGFGNDVQYSVTDLGTLGGTWSYGGGLNEGCYVVGISSTANGVQHAFVWICGVMYDMEAPEGFIVSGAVNVNDNGEVVGYANGQYQSQYAYLWDDGDWTYLGTLSGLNWSAPTDINNAGQISGYSFILGPGGGNRGWIYDDGVMTDIGDLGGDRSTAFGINELGQVVGTADTSTPGVNHAFLWGDGVITDLGSIRRNR
jgi:probable HAF family extracellular repeat protein